MPWLQLSMDTTEEQAPLLELILENLGALSVTLGDAGDQPLLEPRPGEEKIWRKTRITGLFPAEQDADALRSSLNQALNADVTRSIRLEWLADRVWERVWLDHFQPMQFGRRLWICPTGQKVEKTDSVIVEMDPGLAFGTGTHPTTALCLEWLERCELSGKTLIDYGCGSGILAIAALQLGAARAIAVDYDPQAIESTRKNAQKNQVVDRLETYLPENLPPVTADLLIANILAAPLIELAPRVCRLLKKSGKFALSGILTDQIQSVTAAYGSFSRFANPIILDDWALLEGEKITE